MLWLISLVAVVALVFAGIKTALILKKSSGNDKTKELSDIIHKGALAFLNKEYKILVIFVIIITIK